MQSNIMHELTKAQAKIKQTIETIKMTSDKMFSNETEGHTYSN